MHLASYSCRVVLRSLECNLEGCSRRYRIVAYMKCKVLYRTSDVRCEKYPNN